MAQLFKNKTLKTELKDYKVPDFEKKMAIVKSWHEAYKSGGLKKKTETQCEQTFNQSFFVEVLGYKAFPNEIYTIDPKAATETGGQKPDAILGYFSGDTKRVAAVVEIKDVNTPLDKSQQREGNLSPIQQAFKYKPQFKDCSFVIATNFFELRLLKDNQLDFEKFTLEELVSDKDDYFAFKKFYYLLNADNFVTKQGASHTEKILAEIRIEQEEITKAFYKEYRKLRQELIRNIVKNNHIKREAFPLAVEKAQKVIDRIVFICFCEDLGLIPENKLQEVIYHTEKLGLTIPVWDILKGFFTAIDKGSEKLGIPDGYNGELFKEDAELNAFKIEDAICKKFTDFGKYDFEEDLSVNILGHIFEQSISDIEELKNIASMEEMDDAVSKRKKDGIFYTPDYIVDYIVKNTLGAYLQEQEKTILEKQGLKEDIEEINYQKRAIKAYNEYQEFLHNVKVLDPACGSGAFLVKVFDYLLAENKRVAGILADLQGVQSHLFESEGIIKGLLQNNIYGVDLNQESVEITKLSLWLKTAHKGEKLVTLKDNIKCGNSLIDEEAIAGAKSFNWKEEFEEILGKGGFDVIVGNPPYGAELSPNEKRYMKEHYSTLEYNYETYILFFEQALNLLREKGFLGFITPNTFLVIENGLKIRKMLMKQNSLLELVEVFKVFPDAIVEPIIAIIKKYPSQSDHQIKVRNSSRSKGNNDLDSFKTNFFELKTIKELNEDLRFNYQGTQEISSFINKIKKQNPELVELATITTGIKPYQVGKGIPKQTKEIVEVKPFTAFKKEGGGWYPLVRGGQIFRYHVEWEGEYIKYGEWLAEPRNKELFFNEKLLIRRTDDELFVCIDNNNYVCLNSAHVIQPKDSSININYLMAVLNSSLLNWIFRYENFHMIGKPMAEVKVVFVERLPIALASNETQESLGRLAQKMTKNINNMLERSQQFLKLIQGQFQLDAIPRTLQRFWGYEFDAFVKAVKFKGLSLSEREDLLQLFNKYRAELIILEKELKNTDMEINEMVFNLYKISSEEREMILKAAAS